MLFCLLILSPRGKIIQIQRGNDNDAEVMVKGEGEREREAKEERKKKITIVTEGKYNLIYIWMFDVFDYIGLRQHDKKVVC